MDQRSRRIVAMVQSEVVREQESPRPLPLGSRDEYGRGGVMPRGPRSLAPLPPSPACPGLTPSAALARAKITNSCTILAAPSTARCSA